MNAARNASSPLQLQPYKGKSTSIVFGIDVGTTFSGVSYAILEPGEVPKIHGVTRYVWHYVVLTMRLLFIVDFLDRNMLLATQRYPPSCIMTVMVV